MNKIYKNTTFDYCCRCVGEIRRIKLFLLGDGAFGKVHKARHRVTGTLAAAKICKLEVL